MTNENRHKNIADEVARTLFAKYAQRGAKGQRGMGLYFCRLVCEAHGGTIGQQATDVGPVFTVRLPQP